MGYFLSDDLMKASSIMGTRDSSNHRLREETDRPQGPH